MKTFQVQGGVLEMEKLFAVILVICMLLMAVAGMAEETQNPSAADAQKLDATYTLALNAINQED